jgi:hypothetical protein
VLAVPDLKPVMQMRVSINVAAADESSVRFELYPTVHSVPSSAAPTAGSIPPAL